MKRVVLILGLLLVAGCGKETEQADLQQGPPPFAPSAVTQPVSSSQFHAAFPMDVSATVTSDLNCSNSPGPTITLNGEVALSGLNGKLIFSNNLRRTHEHSEYISVNFVLIPDGETISFSKQPPLGGVGGNPHIWFQFLNAEGDPISEEFYLGRCVQGS